MYILDPTQLKLSFTTHAVPLSALAAAAPFERAPAVGDLVLAEVVELNRHTAIETREGVRLNIYPGDLIVGAFGNRYATDQYEGYVPHSIPTTCHILSAGGVLGEVRSRAADMSPPTIVRVIGAVSDGDGRPLRLQQFGMRPRTDDAGASNRRPELILVVGASMNSGKTTSLGTLARALTRAGFSVAAAKITGTASSRDRRFYVSNGASPVVDFTDAGYPSTYLLELDQLLWIHHTLVSNIGAARPDYILVEVADGILQRETRMLLDTPDFRRQVDHVFFNALDSLSAAEGVRMMIGYGLRPRAIVGTITKSPLMMREAEEVTGLRCITLNTLLKGAAVDVLGAAARVRPRSTLERATLGPFGVPSTAPGSDEPADDAGEQARNGAQGTNRATHQIAEHHGDYGVEALSSAAADS